MSGTMKENTAATVREEGEVLPLELPENVTPFPAANRREQVRLIEALLFAADEPLSIKFLAEHLPSGTDIDSLLEELRDMYEGRGVNLVRVAGKWAFRTADDLAFVLERYQVEQRRLSRAALETLAIIAYHQPVTRAEIEEIRGVSASKGTLDVLMETGWVRLRGRRRVPGRPVTYGTTDAFLDHFGFDTIKDLPGLTELKGAGLLDSNLPPGFTVPEPNDGDELAEDEDPLEDEDETVVDLAVPAETGEAPEESAVENDGPQMPIESETG